MQLNVSISIKLPCQLRIFLRKGFSCHVALLSVSLFLMKNLCLCSRYFNTLRFFYTFFSENSLHNELLMLLEYFTHESLSSVLLNARKFVPVYISHSSLSVAKNNIEQSTHIYTCVYIYIYKFTHMDTHGRACRRC